MKEAAPAAGSAPPCCYSSDLPSVDDTYDTYCICATCRLHSDAQCARFPKRLAVPRKNSDHRRPVVPSPETVAAAQQLVHQFEDRPRFVLLDRETKQTFELDETVYELIRS